MMERNGSGGIPANGGANDGDERKSIDCASKNNGGADRRSRDEGEPRSNYSSSDDSLSGDNSSETSSHISYDSEGSEDDSVGSSESSSGNSYHSFSGDSSHASHEHDESERSGRSSGKSDASTRSRNHQITPPDQITPLSSVSSNYSTSSAFRQGVLPIMSRGLDQNSDPNRNTLIHRRGKSISECDAREELRQPRSQPQCRHDDSDNGKGKYESTRSRHRRAKSSRHDHNRSKKSKAINCCIKYFCCQTEKRSTQILVISFVIWILAQSYYFYAGGLWGSTRQGGRGLSGREKKKIVHQSDYFNHHDLYEKRSLEEMEILRAKRAKEAQAALGSGAGDFDPNAFRQDSGGKPQKVNNRRNKAKKSRDSEGSTRAERLREGCSNLEWHSYHFPNCNEIHEIDMQNVVRGRRSWKRRNVNSAGSQHNFPWGFVGAGLWRDVFTCDPHEENIAGVPNKASLPLPPAVLKLMKSEHPYDQRNFQRHRRDALVMERLSSSHHLVPIYGHCANTVLTQAISHTLDDVIYAKENEKVKKWSPHGGYKTKPPLESWMDKDESGELLATRETELGRIRLALGVFRGLMDLHEGDGTSKMEWLPIVHADLQSKQYLVDAQTGKIYLNDFNRCRFVTKKDENGKNSNSGTLESCPLYIPTAPGASRSPEEYDLAPLSEKLDVYSAGNVFYGIITGNRPWNDERGKHIKAAIQKGDRPQVNETIRNAKGTVDAELTKLLDRVYEPDPVRRASAKEVVGELERLLERELTKKHPLQGKKDQKYLAEEEQHTQQDRRLRRRR